MKLQFVLGFCVGYVPARSFCAGIFSLLGSVVRKWSVQPWSVQPCMWKTSKWTTRDFHQSRWSDNKWYAVEVRRGISIENLTFFFLFLRAVVNIPIQTLIIPPWLLLRKIIIPQLELGLPVVKSFRICISHLSDRRIRACISHRSERRFCSLVWEVFKF